MGKFIEVSDEEQAWKAGGRVNISVWPEVGIVERSKWQDRKLWRLGEPGHARSLSLPLSLPPSLSHILGPANLLYSSALERLMVCSWRCTWMGGMAGRSVAIPLESSSFASLKDDHFVEARALKSTWSFSMGCGTSNRLIHDHPSDGEFCMDQERGSRAFSLALTTSQTMVQIGKHTYVSLH